MAAGHRVSGKRTAPTLQRQRSAAQAQILPARPLQAAPAFWLTAGIVALGLALGLAAATPLRANVIPQPDANGVITAHGISVFGDLNLPADFSHLPYVNPKAPKGGELSKSAIQAGFDSMNPFSVQGRAAAGASMMLETILTGTADEQGAAYCLLCTTLEYPQDRSWVIFNLRDDVKFSDGSPLTAEDVLFSYQAFMTKGLQDFRTIFSQQVESAEALGPHQVKFTFKAGFPTRDLPQTVGGLPIFSKAHYIAKGLDLEESSMTPFLGTGPYMPDRIEIGRTNTYKRNPDYWGQALPINIGQNNFDSIRYEYFAETNAAFEGFKGGLYTFRIESSAKQWAEQYNFPALQKGWVKKEALDNGRKASGQAFLFNLRRADWQDERVRRAISMMFNFEWSNKTLFFGAYTRVNSFWENTDLAAEGAPPAEEVALLQPLVDDGLLPASILTDPPMMAPVSGAERQLDRKSLRAASALLDEAGWLAGSDGIRRNAKGQTLSLEVLEDNPQFERVIAPFVENLRALGVDAKLSLIDEAQYEVRTRNPAFDFDMVGFFTPTDYFPGADLQQTFSSSTAMNSTYNLAGLQSPAVDRMIEVVKAASTSDTMKTAVHAMDRVLRAQDFRVPMWYNAQDWVAYFDMYEHPDPLPPFALGETSFWWYNAEKAAALQTAGALR